MNLSDRNAFNGILKMAFDYYQKPVDKMMEKLYFNLLMEYPLESITVALHEHMKDTEKGQFWPKAADLIRYLQGGKGTRALLAWDKAIRAVREVGAYQTVAFDDPLIGAVIEKMDGWPKFCQMEEDEKPFKQREFVERYSAYLSHPPRNAPKSLPGIAEQSNLALGHGADPRAAWEARPVLVGDAPIRPALKPIKTEPPKPLPSGEGAKSRPSVPGMSGIGAAMKAGVKELKPQDTRHAGEGDPFVPDQA